MPPRNGDVNYRLDDHDERLVKLENIVKGDGEHTGIAPMTLAHERQLAGDGGLIDQIRILQTNEKIRAAWTAGAVAVAIPVGQMVWLILKPLVGH